MIRSLSMRARSLVAVCALAAAAFVPGPAAPAGAGEQGASEAAAALVGTWQYVEDRTPADQKRDPRERPPMSASFKVALEEKSLVFEQVRRGVTQTSRVALDGSESVQTEGAGTRATSGKFDAGALTFVERRSSERDGKTVTTETAFTLTPQKDGLLVRMQLGPPSNVYRMSLYRNAKDIPQLTPAKGDLKSLAWLEGRFTVSTAEDGKQTDMEELWGPAGGGAMFGMARTVTDGKLKSFEFLRIVERDGGLVYIAQPGGGPPTEFVLTEIGATRALFENAVNDFPKRIVYERLPAGADGRDGLRTGISDTGGSRAYDVTYARAK